VGRGAFVRLGECPGNFSVGSFVRGEGANADGESVKLTYHNRLAAVTNVVPLAPDNGEYWYPPPVAYSVRWLFYKDINVGDKMHTNTTLDISTEKY